MPKKFLLILMDLGLTLLFLVIIVVAVLDFNSRLKREEQQVRQGGSTAPVVATSSTLAQLQKQKEALTSQVDKGRADLQKLWEENTILTAEIRKKNAEARKLLEDNVALLGQNASLLAQLKQEESESTDHVKLPPMPEKAPSGTQVNAQSPDETPQAKALQKENALLNDQLAQMNTTLQRLYQQKEAQPEQPTQSVARQLAGQTTAGQPTAGPATAGQPTTQPNRPTDAAPPKPGRPTLVKEELDAVPDGKEPQEEGFWNQMVAKFQDKPNTTPSASTTQPDSAPPVEPARIPTEANKTVASAVTGKEGKEAKEVAVVSLPPAAQKEKVVQTLPVATQEQEKTAQTAPVPVTLPAAPTNKKPAQSAPTTANTLAGNNSQQAGPDDASFWNSLLETFQEPSKTSPTAVALPPPPAPQTKEESSKPSSTFVALPPPPAPQTKEAATVVATQTGQQSMATTEKPVAAAPAAKTDKQPKGAAEGVAEPATKPAKSLVTTATPPVPDAEPATKPAKPPVTTATPPVPDAKQPLATAEKSAPTPVVAAAPDMQTVKQPEEPAKTAKTVKQPEKRVETAAAAPPSQAVKTVDKAPEKGWWTDLIASFQKSTTPAVESKPADPATAPPASVTVASSGQTAAAPKPAVAALDKQQAPSTTGAVAPSGAATSVTQPGKMTSSTVLTPAPSVVPKGLPADQAKVVLESVSEGPHTLPVSTVDIIATRKQLLTQIQQGLQQHKIHAEMNEEEGTLYLPGLLDFQNDVTEIPPANRPGMQRLAAVLAKELPCFTRQAGPNAGCSESSHAVKLDSLVIVGNSGPAPVGSSTFRHNWNLANTRALQTFAELVKTHPQLNTMRNLQEQSLFRLDGFLPTERTKSAKTKPMQRVELRFIMGPSPLAARPHP